MIIIKILILIPFHHGKNIANLSFTKAQEWADYQITSQVTALFNKVGKLSPFSKTLRTLISSGFYILPLRSRPIDIETCVRSVVHAWFILNVNPFFLDLLDLVAVGCFLLAARVAGLFDG